MKRLRAVWSTLINRVLTAAQLLISVVRGGKPWHIVITGPDLVGMKHLAIELGRLVPELRISSQGLPAADTQSAFSDVVVSVDADDITRSSEILRTLGRRRNLIVVAPTADPRVMVCAKWPELPHQWADGYDYRVLIGEGGSKSFTEPGVLPRLEGLTRWRSSGVPVISPRREELEEGLSSVIGQIADALKGRRAQKVRSALRAASASATPLAQSPRWYEDTESARRVVQQVALAPALENESTGLGYADTKSLTKAGRPRVARGTIIAFHTPDEVYRAEAARLKSTLDALGLDYRFFEVEPDKTWVQTTLLKPSWILAAREELAGTLLYIDVDAVVHQDPWPYLSQYSQDLAAFVLPSGGFASGTILINDTSGARDLLREWRDESKARAKNQKARLAHVGDDGDQGVLKSVVVGDEQDTGRFSFGRLPVNMTYIFDRIEWYFTHGPVVIEHLQASRESGGNDKRLSRRRERLLQLDAGATPST